MKRVFLSFICFFILFLASCGKAPHQKIIPVQDAWKIYSFSEQEFVQGYTMDEEGSVFVLTSSDKDGLCIHVYQEGLESFTGSISDAFPEYMGGTPALYAESGTLYALCMTYEENLSRVTGASLYSFSPSTREQKKVAFFSDFDYGYRVLSNEKYIYILGTKAGDSWEPTSDYEKWVYRYEKSSGKTVQIQVEGVADLSMNENNELIMLICKEGEKSLFCYDDEKNAIAFIQALQEDIQYFTMISEKQLIYVPSDSFALYLYENADAKKRINLYPFGVPSDSFVRYVNGRTISRAEDNRLVVVSVNDLKKESRTIRFLTQDNRVENSLYSCGYEMEQKEVSDEKLALKILANDKDFDICYVQGDSKNSQKLRNAGSYYPLNELTGITEYLDRCYPYVKEAATKEDGKIWMLPIRVDVPLLFFDQSEQNEVPVPFHENMTFDEFFTCLRSLSEAQLAKTECPDLVKSFLQQYLKEKKELSAEPFREGMLLLKENQEIMHRCVVSLPFQPQYKKGNYLLRRLSSNVEFFISGNLTSYGEQAIAYGYPRINKEDKSIGFCSYLIINPNSDRLSETILFLEHYISYVLHKEKTPLFFVQEKKDRSRFLQSIDAVYQNAEIFFPLEESLYQGYKEVITGEEELESYIKKTDQKLLIHWYE